MKFVVKIEGECVIEADSIMHAKHVWDSMRAEGKPRLLGSCSLALWRNPGDKAPHRGSVTCEITSMSKLEPRPDRNG